MVNYLPCKAWFPTNLPNELILQWILYNEGKRYPVVSDGDAYRAMIEREGGPEALKQWRALEKAIKPLQEGAASFPAAAIRNDIGEFCKDDALAGLHSLSFSLTLSLAVALSLSSSLFSRDARVPYMEEAVYLSLSNGKIHRLFLPRVPLIECRGSSVCLLLQLNAFIHCLLKNIACFELQE